MSLRELEIAKQVWHEAQYAVVTASAKRLEPLSGEERHRAEESYMDAVAECEAAKEYYDEVRARQQRESLRYQPKVG